jgi:hypothetical protein
MILANMEPRLGISAPCLPPFLTEGGEGELAGARLVRLPRVVLQLVLVHLHAHALQDHLHRRLAYRPPTVLRASEAEFLRILCVYV